MGVEQPEQTTGGAAEMSAVQSDVFEESLCAWAGGHQTVSAAVIACAALVLGEPVEVAMVFDLSTPPPGALVRGDIVFAVEDAHEPIGGDEHQGLSHQAVRDRVVVAVESLNAEFRKVLNPRVQFPTDDAALKVLFLALQRKQTRTMAPKERGAALAHFQVLFPAG
jgi:hypothetical protein